jgi:hypothetical protein
LKETAFEQQLFAVDLKEIHGAGGSAGGAEKVNLHGPTVFVADGCVKK